MTIPLAVTEWLPRPAVKYHGCYQLGFEKYVPKWLETENYVHFFAGLSKTGYRIDIKPEVKPDLIADVQDLSMIEDNTFDGGMADPPYDERFCNELYDLPYPKWGLWTRELVRIVKPNGLIGIMQNYIVPKLTSCKYEQIYFIPTRIKQFPKVVTIQRKLSMTTEGKSHS